MWWTNVYGATGAKVHAQWPHTIKTDVMNPIYCSLQDRFASSHGNNHIPLQEISDLPPLICVPGLQDVCTIETAVQDLQGEWTRWEAEGLRWSWWKRYRRTAGGVDDSDDAWIPNVRISLAVSWFLFSPPSGHSWSDAGHFFFLSTAIVFWSHGEGTDLLNMTLTRVPKVCSQF